MNSSELECEACIVHFKGIKGLKSVDLE